MMAMMAMMAKVGTGKTEPLNLVNIATPTENLAPIKSNFPVGEANGFKPLNLRSLKFEICNL